MSRKRGDPAGHPPAARMSSDRAGRRRDRCLRTWVSADGASASGALPGCLAPDRPVHGGPCDAEQITELGGAVLTGFQQRDQVCFLTGIEFGLLAPQSTLGLGDS